MPILFNDWRIIIMKKCINAWCFPGDLPLEGVFKMAKECRYDGVELNMNEAAAGRGAESKIADIGDKIGGPLNSMALTLGMPEKDLENIKRMSTRYGVAISSLSTGLFWKYPLTDNDTAIRDKGMRIVEEMLDVAAYLECGAILVVPGATTDRVSYKTAYERSLAALKKLRPYAERKKIDIGIENVWNKFLMSPLEMAEFVDKIGGEYVKAYFDAGNVLQFSYPEHWVEALGARITRVHIKDFDVGVGNMTGFRNLLQGDMRWDVLMDALKKVEYKGYITAELSPYRSNPLQLIRDTSAAMDYILSL
jgi:hexulose-6-phosphate isomerase